MGSRGPEQSWLELFYDLAFVGAIVVVTSPFGYSPTPATAVWLMIAFSLIWTTWLMSALYLARVEVTDRLELLMLAAQMGLVMILAVNAEAAAGSFASRSEGPLFALILLSSLVLRGRAHRTGAWVFAGPQHLFRKLGALAVFVASAWATGAWFIGLWVVGLVLVLSSLEFGKLPSARQERHLARRFGEFTIIMLGETFVKIGLTASGEPLDELDWIGLPLSFGLLAALWWLYFSLDEPAGIPQVERRRRAWILAHFPLQLGIAMLAIGLSKILVPGYLASPLRGLAVVVGPLVLSVLAIALLDWIGGSSAGAIRWPILLGSSGAMLAVGALSFSFADVVFDLAFTSLLLVGVLGMTRRVIVSRLARSHVAA